MTKKWNKKLTMGQIRLALEHLNNNYGQGEVEGFFVPDDADPDGRGYRIRVNIKFNKRLGMRSWTATAWLRGRTVHFRAHQHTPVRKESSGKPTRSRADTN